MSDRDDLNKQQPLGFLRPKVLLIIAVLAILAAITFAVITFTKT